MMWGYQEFVGPGDVGQSAITRFRFLHGLHLKVATVQIADPKQLYQQCSRNLQKQINLPIEKLFIFHRDELWDEFSSVCNRDNLPELANAL